MNFSFTKAKTITSVIIGIILAVYQNFVSTILGQPTQYYLYSTMILAGIIGMIVVYLIWSLIQKKK